ncbi:hypothetical protein [Tahibacter amnicola]|uniref:Uncharacterized protein n=1 Tax=Tahibacter amnicola TaxID=2976241 RepID=A0ABY6BAD7_9GAMM|nr:hypothetical protein [Tahibacter amnicola]UXI67028.1 hypothetical protein N4264_20080 [Tahibacter amnicola]
MTARRFLPILAPLPGLLALGPSGSATAEIHHHPASLANRPTVTLALPAGTTMAPLATPQSYADARAQFWQARYLSVEEATVPADPTPANPFDLAAGGVHHTVQPLTDPNGSQLWFAVVSLQLLGSANSDTRARLHVGIDRNGDGLPSADETICSAARSVQNATCVLDLRADTSRSMWVVSQLERHTGEPLNLNTVLHGARFATGGGELHPTEAYSPDITVKVPAPLQAGQTFAAEFRYAPMVNAVPDIPLGGIILTDGRYSVASATVIPLAFRFAPITQAAQPYAISPGHAIHWTDPIQVILHPGQAHDRLYIDNPHFDVMDIAADTLDGVDVYISRVDLPPSHVDSTLVRAPPRDQSLAVLREGMSTPTTGPNSTHLCAWQHCASRVPMGKGRWFITPVNRSGRPVTLSLQTAMYFGTDFLPQIGLKAAPGNYYNPQRPGEGLFIDTAAGRDIGYLYTFDDEGAPVWYVLSGDSPMIGLWSGRILAQRLGVQVVGRFSLINPSQSPDVDTLIFSWKIEGKAGSNRLVLGARSGCARIGTANLPISGHWFAPTDIGSGMNILGMGDTTVLGAFFQDSGLRPRWTIGSSTDPGATKSFTMLQLIGACPTCPYVPPTSATAGQWRMTFTSGAQAQSQADIQLVAPLRGGYRLSRDTARATDTVNCL